MYCINCGNEMDDNAKFCSNCGCASNQDNNENSTSNINDNVNKEQNYINNYDVPTKGVNAGSLIFPPFAIAYYFMSKKDFPNKAKSSINAAVYGVIVYVLAFLIFNFIVLPVEKQYALKYECEKGNYNATYIRETNTCKRADGSEYQIILK